MNNSQVINVAEFCPKTKSLGVGTQFVLWVQGCPFNCKNCISQDWIPFEKANIFNIQSLAEIILNTEGIDGLTISGGEPMMQASGLAELLKIIKKEKVEMNIIVFTGFTMKKLNELKGVKDFLNFIDVLITGLYVDELNENKGLRGSSNQEIIYLNDKLKSHKDFFENCERTLEIFNQGTATQFVGIPNKGYKK